MAMAVSELREIDLLISIKGDALIKGQSATLRLYIEIAKSKQTQ